MTLTDAQHHVWFVASLTPHLRTTVSQQKISTEAEALEITMRLHETPIRDPELGVQQIQNLSLEMQSLKQEKVARPEVHEEVWCIKCKGQGHHNDHYLIFTNYLTPRRPILLRPKAQAGLRTAPSHWCTIYQVGRKHNTNNYHLLQKFTESPQQLFFNFCRLVGRNEQEYRSYELLMDRTPAYRMRTEA